MNLDSALYLHPSDKAALAALKAIPGFSQVTKAFMKVWDEKKYRIRNMSTNLKLSDKQMAKYYGMLPPICEKLGIEVPDLYVELDVNPNAGTFGDAKPFIVLTSGLVETMPDELIPTVIAHECGHIACHHSLYTTMGDMILNGASSFLPGIANIAIYPIQVAFSYWMRCSEFSADRAAMIYDESGDKIVEMCMRFAGYDKDIMDDASQELFIDQAKEYLNMVNSNAMDKALEFVMFSCRSHPLNAVRAYEANEWMKEERFKTIIDYVHNPATVQLPVVLNPAKYLGKNVNDVVAELGKLGFADIKSVRSMEESGKAKPNTITAIVVNDDTDAKKDYYPCASKIVLTYFEPKTDDEIAREHPNEIKMVEDSKNYISKPYKDVKSQLDKLGFTNIECKEMAIPKLGLFAKPDHIAKIIVADKDSFSKGEWYVPDAGIKIYFYGSV